MSEALLLEHLAKLEADASDLCERLNQIEAAASEIRERGLTLDKGHAQLLELTRGLYTLSIRACVRLREVLR